MRAGYAANEELLAMMGQNDRCVAPLPPGLARRADSQDHFYHHLERLLKLSFVRDLAREAYADIGRPSIDPVVLFTF